ANYEEGSGDDVGLGTHEAVLFEQSTRRSVTLAPAQAAGSWVRLFIRQGHFAILMPLPKYRFRCIFAWPEACNGKLWKATNVESEQRCLNGYHWGPGMVAAFDEMKGQDGGVRPAYGELARWLAAVPPDVLDYRRREAELIFRRIGITFAVYGEADAQERLIPFDVIPRIMAAAEWQLLEKGLTQRVNALNAFI